MKRAGLGSWVNSDNWIEVLDELLGSLETTFIKSSDYAGVLDFHFKQGCINDASKTPDFHRPSYNLYVTIRGYNLVVVQYELDLQFGLGVTQGEFNRICSLLAKRAVHIIVVFGFCALVDARAQQGTIASYEMKESGTKR